MSSAAIPTWRRSLPRRRRPGLLTLLQLWHDRAGQRRALGQLDDRLLKDIGISRADARCEIDKPFWRA